MTSTPTPRWLVSGLRTYGIAFTLALLIIVVTILEPGFLAPNNLANILSQWAPAGLMAIGMTFVIITGGFDLSVGAIYTMSAVTAAALGQSHSLALAFAVAIALAIALGAINGLLVAFAGVNPFIVTLGTSFAITGFVLVITDNRAFVVSDAAFSVLGTGRFLGIPYSGLLLIAGLIIGGLVLARTVFGQQIYAVGGNREASRLAGIKTRSVITSTYALSGLCAGAAGIVTASQLSSAQAGLGANIVFDVITIVVVGGTSLAGGFGSMWRTAVGLGILATLQNGFNLLDVNPNFQIIVKGFIIVGALALDAFSRRLASRRATIGAAETAQSATPATATAR